MPVPGLCPCAKVWLGLAAAGTPQIPRDCPRQSPAPRAGTPHLNRQSSDGFGDIGAIPCSKQFPFPWLFPSQAPRWQQPQCSQWETCALRGFGKATVPSLEKQQPKNTSKFYFSILLYFTFSRKFLHSSTNLTKSLKFRTNNPVTYYKHEFFLFFCFFNLAVSLGSAAFLPAE